MKIILRFWNGFYYCKTQLPDGSFAELKSAEDLNFTQWKTKIADYWKALQEAQKPPAVCPNCGKPI